MEVGDKHLPCPDCGSKIIVSIIIGFQPYTCTVSRKKVSLEQLEESFVKYGWTNGIREDSEQR
jgi:hypothetical protein